jgi:hypothetical protein
MQGVDYENFMSMFRRLCENVEKIAKSQVRLIELIERQESRPTQRALDGLAPCDCEDPLYMELTGECEKQCKSARQ